MDAAMALLKIPFELPEMLYQGLTMFPLAIGGNRGEELAFLSAA
jgi:hypothetical protein